MTLCLGQGTEPNDLEVKTYGIGGLRNIVRVGDYEISMVDFLTAAYYVLTNTDLIEPDDPRLKFVECIKQMTKVDGYNDGAQRLDSPLKEFRVF